MKAKLLIFFTIIFPLKLYSTVVLKINLQELTRGSDLIFHAVVDSVQVRGYENNGRIKIETEVLFKIRQVLKGNISSKKLFSLILLGGRYKEWELKIPGMPSFKKNEEVILFLEKTSDGYVPTGLSQGKWTITKDKKVIRNLKGLQGFKFDSNGIFKEAGFEDDKIIDFEKFIKEIKTYIEGEKK